MYEEQVSQNFIGRTKEISTFTSWLQDPQTPRILYFYDAVEEKEKKGGIGKTWLLKMCATIAKEKYRDIAVVTIDFSNIAYQDGFAIAKRIVEELEVIYPNWSPTSFTKAIEQYGIPEHRDITTPESQTVVDFLIRDKLFTALVTDLQNLDKQIIHNKRSLLICFDTFEIIEQNPITAVLGSSQTFPDNYQFEQIGIVIAGRNPPNWAHTNWKNRESDIMCVPIPYFSLEDTVQFIKNNDYSGLQQVQHKQAMELYERTQGRPILVGLVVDVLNNRIMTLERLLESNPTVFEASLVGQINQLVSPVNWIILFMAHLHHRFNASLLATIFSQAFDHIEGLQYHHLEEPFKALPSLSFVRSSSNGDMTLHDEMRRLVTIYCWSMQDAGTFRMRKELSKIVIQYYEQEIAQVRNDQQRRNYIIEKLYHQFFLDLNEGFHAFQLYFQQAIRLWNSSFAHLLLLEAQKFECDMSLVQKKELELAQIKLHAVEQDAAVARYVMYAGLARSKGTEFQQNKAGLSKSSEILKVFYSYADEDRELVEQLQMHLTVLKQRNLITDWHKGKLVPGEDITDQIRHLNAAHIILLCISPYFVASDFSNSEMEHALERYKTEKVTVIPILLRPTGNWKDASFGNLQPLPRNAKAVTRWANHDEAFEEMAQEIKEVIDQLRNKDLKS